MNAGDTFLLGAGDIHLRVVISDPAIDPNRIVVVNFTSWTLEHDQDCIVRRGEHPFIRHDTCVNYTDATVLTPTDIEKLSALNLIIPGSPVSVVLLDRMRVGARSGHPRDSSQPRIGPVLAATCGLFLGPPV